MGEVILNFPNNPTGYVPLTDTADKIIKGLNKLKKTATKSTEFTTATKKLSKALSLRNVVGAGIGVAQPQTLPLLGGVVAGKKGLDALAKSKAGKLLPVSQTKLKPLVKALAGTTSGKLTPELLNKLIGEKR